MTDVRDAEDLWHGESDGLVGRSEELRRLRVMLTSGARTAAVIGPAGVGKSALQQVVSRAAASEGWQVLRVGGRASEASLGFACLLDLLATRPAAGGEADVLAGRIRQQVVRDERATGPDALRLRLRTGEWLQAVAGGRPLLVVVDDGHWVDPSSWSVLTFLAHRAAGTSTSFLLCWRSDRSPDELHDHPGLVLAPLGPEQARRLLHLTHPGLDASARRAVVERARGNPLALLELARSGVPGPQAAETAGARVPDAVERAFAAELPGLQAPTRQVLLLAAAGADDLATLAEVLDGRQLARDLEPAERLGLVRVEAGRLAFRHPLVASAVYGSATTAERLSAHELLARAYGDDDERAVRHRAAATLSPDRELAADLARVAQRASLRGAHGEAAEAMVRASELSPGRADREERLLEAVALTAAAGRVGRVAELAGELRARAQAPLVRARADQALAFALAQSMSQSAARDALELALEQLVDLDGAGGWASLTTLASLVYQTRQDVDRAAAWLDRYERTVDLPPAPHDRVVRAARAWSRAAIEPMSTSREAVALVRDTPPGDAVLPPDLVAVEEMLLGATAWLLNEHDVALRRLTKASQLLSGGGGGDHLAQTLMALGQVQFDTGRYGAAARSAALLVDVADAESLRYYGAVGRELLARVAAVRGSAEEARTSATEVLLDLEVGDCLALEANLRVTLAHERFSVRDYRAGYHHLRSLFDAAGHAVHAHVAYRSLADLASMAVRAGEADAVRPVVEVAERTLRDLPGARHVMILCRAKAVLSPEEDAGPLFERAVRDPGAARWPLEWASAHLDYGLWLRRRRRTSEARQRLRTAHEIFQRIGAPAWAALADAELRAAGVAALDGPSQGWSALTAQEREVVELAATGRTNREIGAALFLSPRTVGAHLYHAFPKLGVTARSQLRDVLDERAT